MYVNITEEFKREHPLFIGTKLIYSKPKDVPFEEIANYFEVFRGLHEKFPEFVVGFDLVAQEVIFGCKNQMIEVENIIDKQSFELLLGHNTTAIVVHSRNFKITL